MHNVDVGSYFFTFAAFILGFFFVISEFVFTKGLIMNIVVLHKIYNKWTTLTMSGSSPTGMTKIGLYLPIIITRLIIDSLICNEQGLEK